MTNGISFLWRCPSGFVAIFLALALLGFLPACAADHHSSDDDQTTADDDNDTTPPDDDDNDNDDASPGDDDDDDDLTWSLVLTETTAPLSGVWGSSSSDVFVVGGGYESEDGRNPGVILHYDGSSWSATMSEPTTPWLYGVWGTSASDVFALGGAAGANTGVILHYDGSEWSAMTGPTAAIWLDVWGSSDSDVFAVGTEYDNDGNPIVNGIAIQHYDGSAWSAMGNGTRDRLQMSSVWGSSASNVFALGCNDEPVYSCDILHYDGSSWSVMADPTSPTGGVRVWGTSASDVFVVGGGISHYDGSTWSAMTGGLWLTLADFGGVWGSSSSDVFAVGGAVSYYFHENEAVTAIMHYDGSPWSAMASGTPFVYLDGVWGSSPSDVFAVGNDEKGVGVILHYGPPD
jgi:hypothetical protein